MRLHRFAGTCNADQAPGNEAAGAIALSEQELSDIGEIGRSVSDYLDDDPMIWRF
jgi:hypothetical protein